MKKNISLTKKAKAVLAATLALTLAVPATVAMNGTAVVNAEEEEPAYPEPIAVYDFSEDETVTMVANGVTPVVSKEAILETETEEKVAQVLEFKTTVVTPEVVVKVTSAGVDASGNAIVVTEDVVSAEAQYAHSSVQVPNPFKGMDELVEEPSFVKIGANKVPYWEKGVTISYWQKTTEEEASVISFSNSRENVIHKDDRDKYNIFQMYYANPDDPIFAVGTPEAVKSSAISKWEVDGVGVEKAVGLMYKSEYTVYRGVGSLVRFNPNYPGDGYYLKPVYKSSGALKEYTLCAIGTRFEEADFTDLKKLRTATTKGGLQFNTSGSWGYLESAPTEMFQNGYSMGEDKEDWKSVTQDNHAIAEAFITVSGEAVFQEPSPVNKPGQWQYVTRVIKPDSISTYINGVLVDYELYTAWGQTANTVFAHNAFNLGWGYYTSASEPDFQIVVPAKGNDIYKDMSGISIQPEGDGKLLDRLGFNGNTDGMTTIEMLVDGNTTLNFGGMATGLETLFTREIGTYEGTALAEVAFFAEPLNQDQITALYEDASAMTAKEVEVQPGQTENPGQSEEPQPGQTDNPPVSEPSPVPPVSGGTQESPVPGESQKPDNASGEPVVPGTTNEAVTLGNVDGKDGITLDDAQMTLRIALLLIEDATEAQKKAADVDGVGGVTLTDAQLVLRRALLLITKFPLEENK